MELSSPNSWLLEPGTGSQRTFQAENTVWAKAQRWRSMCSAWETAWEKQGRAGVAVAAMTLVRPAKARLQRASGLCGSGSVGGEESLEHSPLLSAPPSPQLSWPSWPLRSTGMGVDHRPPRPSPTAFPEPPPSSLHFAEVTHPPRPRNKSTEEGHSREQELVCVLFVSLESSQGPVQSKGQGCFLSKKMSRISALPGPRCCPCPWPLASEGLTAS